MLELGTHVRMLERAHLKCAKSVGSICWNVHLCLTHNRTCRFVCVSNFQPIECVEIEVFLQFSGFNCPFFDSSRLSETAEAAGCGESPCRAKEPCMHVRRRGREGLGRPAAQLGRPSARGAPKQAKFTVN